MLEEAGVESGEVYEKVYWTKSGTVYHLFEDCGHLKNSPDLMDGTSVAAVENGKTRLCKTCYSRAVAEGLIEETGETVDPDNTEKTDDSGKTDDGSGDADSGAGN